MSIFKKLKPLGNFSKIEMPDPSTGRLFKDTTIDGLAKQIRGYREANELEPLDFLESTIENYLCHLPIHVGQCAPIKNAKRSVVQMLQGGIWILKNISYARFCSQEEADRRSEICTQCPHNSFPDKTGFPKWCDELAVKSVGSKRSKNHDKLGVCDLCSCPLRSKTWFDGKIKLTQEQYDQMSSVKEVDCWQIPLAEVSK